jgi:hypothetical protein
MKKRDKRGQFYLLAAIIIIGIILGLTTLPVLQRNEGIVKVYDLAEELNLEGGKVIDYSIVSGEQKIEDFIEKFSEYSGEERELYFVYGNYDDVNFAKFSEVSQGKTSYKIGEETYNIENPKGKIESKGAPLTNNKVKITLDEQEYELELNEGENFLFIISEEVGDSKHIVSS